MCFDKTDVSLTDKFVVHHVMPTEVPSASDAECALRVSHADRLDEVVGDERYIGASVD